MTAYPEVKFVTPSRDGRKMVGKPCIYFDDILDYCKTSTAEVFGIINSDIHLAGDDSLLQLIEREARGSLLYGSRYEVDSPVSARGWLYTSGFDYFFFDRTLLGIYPRSDFMLGVPWWDYWAPLIPAIAGIPLKNLHAPVAFHVSHPINYSWEQLRDFGLDLVKLVGKHRITEMHERHNRSLNNGNLPEPDRRSVTVLADMVRYQISSTAQHLEWHGAPCHLNANQLIQLEENEYRVTAIVSTYNSAAFIGACLQDLLNQTIADDIDIIVIDAASPQDERSVVEDFQNRHPNIRYVRTPVRIGVYAAWNMAARMAKGHYLISCSTNDRLRPDALELMAQTLDERPEVSLVYGNSYLTHTPHKSFDAFDDLAGLYDWPDFSFEGLLREPGIGPHPMWRCSLHQRYGYFNEDYKAIGDQDFWLRVARHETFLHIWDFTGLYLLEDDSLSGNKPLAQAEYREIREKHAREYHYRQLVENRIFHKALGRFYEERIPQWRSRVLFEMLVIHDIPDHTGLVATIQSFAGQYYDNIHLTVLSVSPKPDNFAGARMSWVHVPDQRWAQAFNRVLENSRGDWLGLLHAGDRVAPHTFLLIGEHLNRNPGWKLLYTDEDQLDTEGERFQPLLKPDCDIDLLRNQWYLGGLILAERAFLRLQEGLAHHDLDASWYEAALRTAESGGVSTVGHVPDVLYHRRAPMPNLRFDVARSVLLRHLQRTSLAATIEGGIMPGSWRLVYARPRNPQVSVLLLFEGNVARLERALVGFLDSTGYQETELLIIDRGETDETTRRFMEGLRQLGEKRIRVYEGHYERNMAEAVNHAAETVWGEFLLLFEANLAVVHRDWLDVLLSHALRPEVGVVGPRMIYADGQLHRAWNVLGMMGPADTPYRGVHMEYPGYMHRLHIEQGVAALGPECLLVSKALFFQLGGLNPIYADPDAWSLDFLLQSRLTGKTIIWTPYSTLLISGDACALETSDEQWRKESGISDDQDRLYQHWLKVLYQDPTHNPSLSRSERGMSMEIQPLLGWDITPWKPVPNILAHIADFEGCGNYRVLLPLNSLVRAGWSRGNLLTSYLSPPELATCQPDTAVFQRVIKPEGVSAVKRYTKYGASSA